MLINNKKGNIKENEPLPWRTTKRKRWRKWSNKKSKDEYFAKGSNI